MIVISIAESYLVHSLEHYGHEERYIRNAQSQKSQSNAFHKRDDQVQQSASLGIPGEAPCRPCISVHFVGKFIHLEVRLFLCPVICKFYQPCALLKNYLKGLKKGHSKSAAQLFGYKAVQLHEQKRRGSIHSFLFVADLFFQKVRPLFFPR